MDQNEIQQAVPQQPTPPEQPKKFCQHCGAEMPVDAVVCTHCGRQVSDIQQAQPQIVINNSNTNTNTNTNLVGAAGALKAKNKWTALILCFFFGWLGVHKFYEGKIGMGILYICTVGLFGIGVLVDFIKLLFKPNPYYVL